MTRDSLRGIVVTRRTALLVGAGALAAVLAGCVGRRSDQAAVQAALQAAVERVPDYVDGAIHFVDGASPGTSITGNIVVDTATTAETEQALERIHEAIVRTYLQQPDVRTAGVRIRAYPPTDAQAVVESADIAAAPGEVAVDTDQLAAQFGLTG